MVFLMVTSLKNKAVTLIKCTPLYIVVFSSLWAIDTQYGICMGLFF